MKNNPPTIITSSLDCHLSENRGILEPYLEKIGQRFLTLYNQNQLPKAILLVHQEGEGSNITSLILQRLLCEQIHEVCSQCKQCRLFLANEHPDLHAIQLEKGAETIKVEAVRNLQESLYLSPQIARRRVVYLSRLELFTPSAVNALLKIVEEPPELVYFVATTQQIDRLVPTILSRFQRWILPSPYNPTNSYLDLCRWKGKSAEYHNLLGDSAALSEAFIGCLKGQISLITLAENWAKYPLKDLLQVLYCLISEGMKQSLMITPINSKKLESWQYALMLDKIVSLLLQLRQCPAANPLLTLESGLLALTSIASRSQSDGENSLHIC